ncbi:MAG: hypothetical protein WCQ21_22075 [Verrucomicrobiota bacterium]
MTRFLFFSITAAAVLVVGCRHPTLEDRILALPSTSEGYRADPYIELAAELQTSGRDSACAALLRVGTNANPIQGFPVYVLCRMVFTNRPTGDFYRPSLGAVSFLGDTADSDWPLEPIELIDGIPFVVTTRYMIQGQIELPAAYVRYCMNSCAWSSAKFTPRTKGQKKAALAKLLASKKWRTPLSQGERDYLADQLR